MKGLILLTTFTLGIGLLAGCGGGGSAEEQVIELHKQQAAKHDEIVALYESDLPREELQSKQAKLVEEVQELEIKISEIMPKHPSETMKASKQIVSDAEERRQQAYQAWIAENVGK